MKNRMTCVTYIEVGTNYASTDKTYQDVIQRSSFPMTVTHPFNIRPPQPHKQIASEIDHITEIRHKHVLAK
ncbi:hypothetical protein DPMN_077412 [Dreissena polymorpha]|uniref:Uncharacterized protein n=1 Tax=Dreissena polymorpha TaxID=45954 RepID=A0A9D4BN98_DREPO|nr:hypothetical protein DPMN_077412 [Dreissena polymorpha]